MKFILYLATTFGIVEAVYYKSARKTDTCANRGSARFGFPIDVGKLSGNGSEISPSGLAHSRLFSNVLYFVSDKSGQNVVFAVNSHTGETIGSVTITDAVAEDWEDVTVGVCPPGISGSCLYIQEQDVSPAAPQLAVYVIREPANPAQHVSRKADKIIRYEFEAGVDEDLDFNGLFVDCTGNIYFFEERDYGLGLRLFLLQETGDRYTARGVLQLDLPTVDEGPVGLSMSDDCCELLVKQEDKVYVLPLEEGRFAPGRLQVLPYLPRDDEEESVTWGPGQNSYYTVSEDEPHVLRVAYRNTNVPEERFSLGQNIGTIDNEKINNIGSLASSRRRLGFLYAVSDKSRPDTVSIIQVFETQTVGSVKLPPGTGRVLDIAPGPCPTGVSDTFCLYLSLASNRVLVIPEPSQLYTDTSPAFSIVIPYKLPDETYGKGILVGRNGSVFVFDVAPEVDDDGSVTVYRLQTLNGTTSTALPVARFPSPSIRSGPEAVALSPCQNEILVKFLDTILLFEVRNHDIPSAFRSPVFLPYIPELEGRSVAFFGCDTFLTTSGQRKPASLRQYSRLADTRKRRY